MVDYKTEVATLERLLAAKDKELAKILQENIGLRKENGALKKRKEKVEVSENADYYYDYVWTTVMVKDYNEEVIFEETYKVV